ncbi:MAG: hypothetical protein AB1726_01435 [Planctomycetota bacterium]
MLELAAGLLLALGLAGPARFDGVLPLPAPRPPYFGEAGLAEEAIRARAAFYADEAVLAVPRRAAPPASPPSRRRPSTGAIPTPRSPACAPSCPRRPPSRSRRRKT